MSRTRVLLEIRQMRFADVYEGWRVGRLSQEEAAEALGVSDRTFRRFSRRFEEEGANGLLDRRLGQVSARLAPVDEVMALTSLYRARYADWTVKHFFDFYQAEHRGARSYTWVKQSLQAQGVVVRAKRRGAHRRKRERRPLPGMLLHQDGSRHEWLAGSPCDLILTMDDATSEAYSAFLVDEEGTMSSFLGVQAVIERKGLFSSLYTDRGSHYWLTPKAGAKVDRQQPTQFHRALEQLGIELIAAYSPQARGRSERTFKTWQERLPRELALAGITTMAEANRYIKRRFLPTFNRLFSVPPENPVQPSYPSSAATWPIPCACKSRASWAMTTACAIATSGCRSRPTIIVAITSKPPCACTSIPTPRWRSFMARAAWRATPPRARQCKRNRGARHNGKPMLPAHPADAATPMHQARALKTAYRRLAHPACTRCTTPIQRKPHMKTV